MSLRKSHDKRYMKNHFLALVAASLIFATGTSSARYNGGLPAPQDERVFTIDEATLPFPEFIDPRIQTERSWGVLNGAGYRYEVPANWNGELVMWAHGFVGNQAELEIESHPFREFLIAQGFAWASSSYDKNYYDVQSGVRGTNELVRLFAKEVEKPSRVFIVGASMGGHVTAAAVEQFPNYQCPEGGRYSRLCNRIVDVLGRISGGVKYSGAVPVCGVMADRDTLGYTVDYRLVAEQLAGVPNQFPTDQTYLQTTAPILISQLYANGGAGFPTELSETGLKLKEYFRQATGGARPGFDQAFAFAQAALIPGSLGDGTFDGVVGGNLFDNRRTVYQLDGSPELSAEEEALNKNMLRIKRDRRADPARFLRLQRLPQVTGRLTVPTVTLHTTGDLRVPFSNQTIYAKRVASRGASDFLIQRAIRDVGHCTFDPQEAVEAFTAMYAWATFGVKPEGDDVTTPEVIADENYGCKFTRRDRVEFGIAACPTN